MSNMSKERIQRVGIEEIATDVANLNAHSERGNALTDKSIAKFGPRLAGLLDKAGRIIDGNARAEIYADKGIGEIEIVQATPGIPLYIQYPDLDLADPTNPARELQLALHRSAVESFTIDAENLLAAMNEGTKTDDWLMQDELDALLAGMVTPDPVVDPGADISKADVLQEKWKVKTGDLFILDSGKGFAHRLICGDCTDKATVERLMGGEKADFCFTDPPYNVGVLFIEDTNDNRTKSDFIEWCKGWTVHLPERKLLTVGIKRLVWWGEILGDPQWIIAWVKRNGQGQTGLGGTNKWDAILVYGVKVDNDIDIVEVNNDYSEGIKALGGHPTAKPVELWCKIIGRFTLVGENVYEPFGGSGTTLISCEQLRRNLFCMEISAPYVSLALERWSIATNTQPVRVA